MLLGCVRGQRRESRHRMEHCELPSPRHIADMRSVGISACVQPTFEHLWGGPGRMYERGWVRRAWDGRTRSARCSPRASAWPAAPTPTSRRSTRCWASTPPSTDRTSRRGSRSSTRSLCSPAGPRGSRSTSRGGARSRRGRRPASRFSRTTRSRSSRRPSRVSGGGALLRGAAVGA